MRFALILFVSALSAQSFDPKMPDNVPPVTGKVVEAAAFRYIDVKPGDGAPAQPGQEYSVQYTGWLRDGTQFDSSVGRDPIKFIQGRRQVIAGWEMGFEGMRVGGKRRLFIPYQLAYGEQGRGPIPPKAELVFDVELLDVKEAPAAALPAAEMIATLTEIESQVMQLAKAVPEDKYGWRPAPGVRSFQQVFLHIAYGNTLLLHVADEAERDALTKEIESNAKNEEQPVSKEKTLATLADSFAAVHKYMEDAKAPALAREVDFFGKPSTRRGVLIWLDAHVGEHLGQAIAYARMNGITPPWSAKQP